MFGQELKMFGQELKTFGFVLVLTATLNTADRGFFVIFLGVFIYPGIIF